VAYDEPDFKPMLGVKKAGLYNLASLIRVEIVGPVEKVQKHLADFTAAFELLGVTTYRVRRHRKWAGSILTLQYVLFIDFVPYENGSNGHG
jgi:hypothetical protein